MEEKEIGKRLGNSVRHWRTRLKIPQDDLARRAGLQRSYVSDVERGTRNISLKSLAKLAVALGVPVATLLAEEAPVPITAPGHAEPRPREGVDILLVQDGEQDTRLILEAMGSARQGPGPGNRIFVVRHGVAALEFLFCTGRFAGRSRDQLPRVVLLDLALPMGDAVEVLRRIKADRQTCHISVVMLIEDESDAEIAACRRLGAVSFVAKPIDTRSVGTFIVPLSVQWEMLKQAPVPGI